jgi:rfaE bifunctional protein nucleotidyltransferase chain/domain
LQFVGAFGKNLLYMPRVMKLQVKKGVSVTVRKLVGFRGDKNPLLHKKLVTQSELTELGDFYRKHGIKISFTTGAYDLIHVGHVRYLELAATLGEILVVGLNSDSSVKKYKGDSRPIMGELQRAEMLCYLSSVTYVVIYPELTGAETIRLLKPDAYLCVEGSWKGDLAAKDEVMAMAECGGKVFYTPRQSPVISTSAIIDRVKELERPAILEELQRAFIASDNEKK